MASSSSAAHSRISTLQNHLSPLEANNKLRSLVKISPEVSEAISNGGAVVALESTIISHGLNEEELERLASLGKSVQKTAGRDIAHAVDKRGNGATSLCNVVFRFNEMEVVLAKVEKSLK